MQIKPGVKLYPSEVTASQTRRCKRLLPPSLPPSPHRLNPEGDFIYGVTRIVKVRLQSETTHNSLVPTELSELQQKICLSQSPDQTDDGSVRVL